RWFRRISPCFAHRPEEDRCSRYHLAPRPAVRNTVPSVLQHYSSITFSPRLGRDVVCHNEYDHRVVSTWAERHGLRNRQWCDSIRHRVRWFVDWPTFGSGGDLAKELHRIRCRGYYDRSDLGAPGPRPAGGESAFLGHCNVAGTAL